ncbi:hypothetical protein BASA62_007722 [Batrachochytrium salamandrivorans]|nr:hypothetical protein BASA62_007722 [Batrachochytrium salamandrivorans]
MKTRQSIPHSGIGWWVLQVSLANFHKAISGGISTVWIDTVQYATCRKSANRAAQYPIIMPRPHRFIAPQSPSNQPLVQICFAIYDSTAEPSIYILHTRIECCDPAI